MGEQRLASKKDSSSLVASVLEGDGEAEQQLLQRYGRGVMILLRARTRNPDLANDLYQDTFELVFRKVRAGDLRNPDALQSFIHQIAVNLATEHFRKAQRRGENDALDPEDVQLVSETLAPEEFVAREQRLDAIRKAITALPTVRDRLILRRYFLDQHARDVICDDLDLDATHFRRVLYRAIHRLKTSFMSRLEGGEP